MHRQQKRKGVRTELSSANWTGWASATRLQLACIRAGVRLECYQFHIPCAPCWWVDWMGWTKEGRRCVTVYLPSPLPQGSGSLHLTAQFIVQSRACKLRSKKRQKPYLKSLDMLDVFSIYPFYWTLFSPFKFKGPISLRVKHVLVDTPPTQY